MDRSRIAFRPMRAIYRNTLFAFLPFVLAAACSFLPREEPRVSRTRYLHLPSLFDYLTRNDREAGALNERRENLRGRIAGLESKLGSGGEGIPEAVLKSDIKKFREELQDVTAAEDLIRKKYYRTIHGAVTAVAGRMRIDYVFNIGEGLVYAPREDDITELVIQELSGMKARKAPQSR